MSRRSAVVAAITGAALGLACIAAILYDIQRTYTPKKPR